jgi:hypothetical protein
MPRDYRRFGTRAFTSSSQLWTRWMCVTGEGCRQRHAATLPGVVRPGGEVFEPQLMRRSGTSARRTRSS